MEQAINQFTKGLQMDTHPMVQGNDTLTDCLNGTLITMNGDEVILQNDMGNRRVDQAFLPAGYEPVGIKEYGGIIYIAAYNPITNQSQIGCFPSPQRNYNNVGKEQSISLSYGNNGFRRENRPSGQYGQTYYLVNDSYLKILIDKPLIPGDKFLTTFNSWDSNITLDEDDPKKLYSIYYGILNSQNQFVDISNSLKRWIINLTNDGTIFGYHFLVDNSEKPSGTDWSSSSVTESTRALEESRLSYDMNTYSGKLVGYPYIKVQINHPVNFTYSYTGFRINDTTVQLNITGKLDYNCPHGTLDQSRDNEGEPTGTNNEDRYGFSLCYNKLVGSNLYIAYRESPIEAEIIQNPQKDETTDLYSIVIQKKYQFENVDCLNAQLAVPVQIEDPDNTYLRDLSIPINLDFSLFGSNKLILTSWGFKKDGNDIILRYNIDNYFSNVITYSDLKLTLTDITTTPSNPIDVLLDGIGGTIRIPRLTDRHIYTAKISHKIKDQDGNYIQEEGSDKIQYVENTFKDVSGTSEDRLWILNTHLFDECYSSGDKYIKNYCNRTDSEQEIFDKLTEINIYIDGNLTEDPSTIVEDHIEGTGYVECSVESDISFKVTNTISKQFSTSGLDIKTENENLYPDNINDEFDDKDYQLELINTLTNVKDIGGEYYFGNLPNYLEQYLNITSEIDDSEIDDDVKIITITYPDFFYGQAASKTYIDDVPFVFHKIDDEIINNWSYSNQGALDFRISEYPLSSVLSNNRIILFSEGIGNNNIAAVNIFTDLDHPVNIHGVDLHNVAFTKNENYQKELLIDSNNQLNLTTDNVIQNPTKYSFMYREDDQDSLVVEASIAGFGGKATYGLKHAQMEVHKQSGTPIVAKYNGFNESRNEGEKKCLIYTKSCQIGSDITISDSQNTSNLLNTPIDENSNLRWGIIPGMINLQDNIQARKNVISKIKSLFDSQSRMCIRSKERIGVYTIKRASENSTSYYSRIINFNYKQNININGSINNTQIDFTNWESNKKLSFKVNNTCNNLSEVTFVLNSYDDYIQKLNTEYPHINPYLDLSTGKYINDTRFENFQLTQHFVYVPNQGGGFRPVNNILMLYCDAQKDYFGPVFDKDTSNEDYSKLVSYIQVNDNINEFTVDLTKFTGCRPYPIKQLT